MQILIKAKTIVRFAPNRAASFQPEPVHFHFIRRLVNRELDKFGLVLLIWLLLAARFDLSHNELIRADFDDHVRFELDWGVDFHEGSRG